MRSLFAMLSTFILRELEEGLEGMLSGNVEQQLEEILAGGGSC